MAAYCLGNFVLDPSPNDRLMYIYNCSGKLMAAIDPYSSTFFKKSFYVYIVTDGKMDYNNVLDFSSESEADLAVARLNDVKKIFIDRTNQGLTDVVTIEDFQSHTGNTSIHITQDISDLRYVKLSGDTMYGKLTIPELNISLINTGSTGSEILVRKSDGNIESININTIVTTSIPWSGITNTPTTLSGYSITDVYDKNQTNNNFLSANTFDNIINTNGLNNAGDISATTFYGDGSNLTGIVTTNTFTTGATLSASTAIFNRNDGVSYNLNLSGLITDLTPYYTSAQTNAYFVSASTYNYYTGTTVPTLILDINNNLTAHTSLTGSSNPHQTSFFDLISTAHTHIKSNITDFTEGDYVHTTGSESIAGNKTFDDNVTVRGNLYVIGTATTIYTEDLSIKDNLITINSGETNSGVTKRYAGIEVDRGALTNYVFLFDENQDNFRIGQSENLTGGTQAVSTREDNPSNSGISFWNANEYRFDTSNNLIWNGDKLNIIGDVSAVTYYGDGSNLTGLVATLSGLTDVILNTLITGNTLIYSGGSWKNTNQPWEYIINKPTTLNGYGITDVYTTAQTNANYLSANTTLSYFGGVSLSVYNTYTGTTIPNILLGYYTSSQTNSNFLSANTSFYTQTQANSKFVYKTGDTMTGTLQLPSLTATTICGTTYYGGVMSLQGSSKVLSLVGTVSGNSVLSVNGTQGQLFSVTDSLDGSLLSVNDISGFPILEVFSDKTTIIGDYLAPSLYATKSMIIGTGSTTIYSLVSSAYTGAFYDYIITGNVGMRSGSITAIWSGSTVNYCEISTSSIGVTTAITFSVILSGSSINLNSYASVAGYNMKTIIRSI